MTLAEKVLKKRVTYLRSKNFFWGGGGGGGGGKMAISKEIQSQITWA